MINQFLRILAGGFLVFILNSSFVIAEHSFQLKVPSSGDIASSDAANIALEYVLQEGSCILLSESEDTYDFPLIELENRPIYCKTTFVSYQQQDAWIVSFFPEDIPMLAATVSVSSPSGIVIDSTFGFTITMQKKWEKEKGAYYFWTIDDKYMFDMLYSNPMQSTVHVLPESTDISLVSVKQIACEAIAKKYKIPLANATSDFMLESELVSISGNRRLWRLFFRKENSSGVDYDLFYWVYVDAVTGTVVEIDENAGGLG